MNTMGSVPSEAQFDAMGDAIQHRAIRADQRRHRRSVGIVASVAVATMITGVGAVVLATTEMQRDVTYCYQDADTRSAFTQVGTPSDLSAVPSDDRVAAAELALEKCAAVWRIGFFDTDGVPETDGRVYPVPELQLCVRSDGVSAVLPRHEFAGSDAAFCDELGLAAPW